MELGSLVILGNALILGVRHGIDWDHIAAIADIVGTANATKVDSVAISLSQPNDALRLSLCYALGHAIIVLLLGIAALMFAAVLPEWIDPFMERAVGVTLLLLGLWIFYSLTKSATAGNDFVMQSRWMFLLDKIQKGQDWFHSKKTPKEVDKAAKVRQYSASTAFGVGAIHGFGAETGTQVLLIAAVGGSSTHVLGVMILLSFISGLLISNTAVALVTCAGFANSAKFKSIFVAVSVITGLFSLAIGAVFACNRADVLPDLQR
ncbi:MAG: hypothetical protein JST89_10075 [Cyanobacteria bacterium SZAS-4]|nr:hypothetical protein [Cyanobacteria bacterium SZAS-4]